MFTGIIQNISKLEKIDHRSKNYTFILNSNLSFNKNDLGTSISVDGVCLTLVKVLKFKKINKLFFNISPETLKISSLKFKKKGDLFNLEKSLKYGDEIAGHFVQGHVDDVGKVISITKNKNSWCFWFSSG